MNYYALLVVLIIVFALFMQGNQYHNKKYVIVACILLFSIYGLRDTYRIGVDTTSSYIGNFYRVHNASWADVVETHPTNTGFYLFTKVFTEYVGMDYQLYISLISLFVTICFGRLIYRYSPSPVQSILYHFGLLLFIFHFSALKQSIAMAILMLAFDPLIERKPFRFILTVLIAGEFHLPSLVFLPIYWIALIKPGKKYVILLAILLVLTYVFRNAIINFLNELYKNNDEDIDLSGIQFLRTKALIMIGIVVVAMVLRVPTGAEHVYWILLECLGLAIVFQTFCGYSNSFERLADYYFQFSVIFIPMAFDKNVERKTLFNWRYLDVINSIAPYVFCGYGIYRFLSFVSNYRFYSPFRFFFQA